MGDSLSDLFSICKAQQPTVFILDTGIGFDLLWGIFWNRIVSSGLF